LVHPQKGEKVVIFFTKFGGEYGRRAKILEIKFSVRL